MHEECDGGQLAFMLTPTNVVTDTMSETGLSLLFQMGASVTVIAGIMTSQWDFSATSPSSEHHLRHNFSLRFSFNLTQCH